MTAKDAKNKGAEFSVGWGIFKHSFLLMFGGAMRDYDYEAVCE